MATIQAIDQVMDQYNKYEFKGTIYESDIWDCEILGLQKSSVHSMYKLNFTTLYPSWLRLITKQFIKFILNTKQFSTALSCNSAIVRLGLFITKHVPECRPDNIPDFVTFLKISL